MAEKHPCDESYEECMRSHREIAEDAVKANPNASLREIAKDLPVSHVAIKKAKDRGGVKALTEHDPSGIKAALREDPSRRNTVIAKICGVNEASVRQARQRLGMPPSAWKKNVAPTLPSPDILASEHNETMQEAIRKGKYSDELMDWIFTYQSWSKRLQKQAREVFFAVINGVVTNGAMATSGTDSSRPVEGKGTAHTQ
jgi:hypothetical protein